LFMAWMMGMYFVSSVLLMRMNLPLMYRKAITEVHACDASHVAQRHARGVVASRCCPTVLPCSPDTPGAEGGWTDSTVSRWLWPRRTTSSPRPPIHIPPHRVAFPSLAPGP
jgi:hypothetical protein